MFSLRSNNRLPKPMKFEIINTDFGYTMKNKSNDCLIEFGQYNIYIYKNEMSKYSKCYQSFCFDNHGYEQEIIGEERKEQFTPKRIVVLQMI